MPNSKRSKEVIPNFSNTFILSILSIPSTRRGFLHQPTNRTYPQTRHYSFLYGNRLTFLSFVTPCRRCATPTALFIPLCRNLEAHVCMRSWYLASRSLDSPWNYPRNSAGLYGNDHVNSRCCQFWLNLGSADLCLVQWVSPGCVVFNGNCHFVRLSRIDWQGMKSRWECSWMTDSIGNQGKNLVLKVSGKLIQRKIPCLERNPWLKSTTQCKR